MSLSEQVKPVGSNQRHVSLDALRGFALLGILVINISLFGLPGFAIMVPTVAGGYEGANETVWLISNLFFEGSMRTLFSIMFGAGVILITTRMVEKGQGDKAFSVYYLRTFWLLVFGLLDAFIFLWSGDILFMYGLAGLLLYPLAKLSAKALMRWAVALFVVFTLLGTPLLFQGEYLEQTYQEASQTLKDGGELSAEQQGIYDGLKPMADMMYPKSEDIDRQVENMLGGYGSAFDQAFEVTMLLQWEIGFPDFLFDVLMMMLFGMVFIQRGVLTNECKTKTYVLFMVFGYGIGIGLRWLSSMMAINSGFDMQGIFYGFGLSNPSRFALAFGHIGLIMLIIRSGVLSGFVSALASVGRMALSNYLMQSIICAFIFYGFGFGLYNSLERYELFYVVAGIWAFQIAFSVYWLKHYRFGPFEWLWRSLTYVKKQPMLRENA